jgi:hypothetical protein
MCRIHDDIIGQGHDLVVQALVQEAGKVLLRQRTHLLRQVRTAHIADEERVARVDAVRLTVLIDEQVTCALHGMPGRMQHLDGHLAELQLLPILRNMRFE